MVRKQLLTVGCVLGILACGACFLPPIKTTPTYPPAPLREELHGIKAIRVVVDDASATHFVDASQVAACVTQNLDGRAGRTHIRSDNRETPRAGNALLRITIKNVTTTENQYAQQGAAKRWSLGVTIDATLSDADGKTLWEQKDQTYRDDDSFESDDPATIWKTSRALNWLSGRFSDQILGAMFYGN